MKNFLRRLRFFGIGFGIGIVFVVFFFQNRGCTWLPSNRVKNSILDRVVVLSDEQEALLRSHGLSEKDVVGFLNDGDVEFGKSKKDGNPQVYSLTRDIKGKTLELWFTLPANSFISEVQWPQGSIQRAENTQQGSGRMIHFPNVKSMVSLDDNKRFLCQQDKTGLIATTEVFNRLKKTGTVDFGLSHLKTSPKAEHYIRFTNSKGMKIAAVTVWNKEHIAFTGFILADSLDCPSY